MTAKTSSLIWKNLPYIVVALTLPVLIGGVKVAQVINSRASYTPDQGNLFAKPPAGCTYEHVACIKAPCLPVLRCNSSPTPTVAPPTNCFYKQVQCVKAPCPAMMVCITPTPTPGTKVGTPSGCSYQQPACKAGQICPAVMVCATPALRATPDMKHMQQPPIQAL